MNELKILVTPEGVSIQVKKTDGTFEDALVVKTDGSLSLGAGSTGKELAVKWLLAQLGP